MEQYRDSQYDDDLTVGMDEKEELFDTGFVDLFEYSGDDESPIARLKTIVLSIDWEINDEVLTQFNEELIDLKDIWADDAIKLVYIQALEKIGKYIYQQKSDAHPNAIKLLLSFYYNLEKIVLNEDLTEEEKKEILREDVKKFDHLKQQIGRTPDEMPDSGNLASPAALGAATISEQSGASPILFNLKACILGMDWEITERELSDLSREIKILEDEFAGNKPKMLFLQGIGALGGYIKLKKSNAHADAFKLLYSFYEGLEKIVVQDLSLEEEKKVLLPEVEKFEVFKKTIASTITPDIISGKEDTDQGDDEVLDDSIAPAFADIPEETKGFQAEEEKRSLDDTESQDVEGRLDSFFTDESEDKQPTVEPVAAVKEALPKEAQERIDSFFNDEEEDDGLAVSISPEEALRGVDVETEADDDSDEDALPLQVDGALAPALAESDDGNEHGFNPELSDADTKEGRAAATVPAGEHGVADFFGETDDEPNAALAGVNVETEADDDSDEAPLPTIDDEIAPALFGGEDEEESFAETGEDSVVSDQIAGFFDDDEIPGPMADSGEQTPEDIESRLDSFFGDDAEEPSEIKESETEHIESEEEILFDDSESEPFEEESKGDIEDEIDSFFSEDDGAEDMFRAVPEGEGETAPVIEETEEPERQQLATELEDDDSAAFSLTDEEEGEISFEPADEKDEEITFEPAEEEDEEFDGDLPVAVLEGDESPVDDDLSSFGSGTDEQDFFAAIDERVDEPGEFQMEILDETDEFEGSEVAITDDEERQDVDDVAIEEETISAVEEVLGEGEEEAFTFASDDNLANLRDGIASLGVEINESIVDGILSEINGLRHQMMTKPIEKTLLQLVSTIVQHIGQYGYEASAEAHGLLLSVFDKLELVQNAEIQMDEAQEVLLAETSKVLLWQQKMLDRQAVRKGDQLTFIAPVRTDEKVSDSEDGEDRVIGDPVAEEEAADEDAEDKDFSAVFEPVDEDVEETVLENGSDDLAFMEQAETDVASEQASMTEEPYYKEDDLFEELDTEEKDLFPDDEEDLTGDYLMGAEDVEREDDTVEVDDEVLLADTDSGIEPGMAEEEQPAIEDFVKREIDALRQSLKQEIEELKRQLKEK